MPVCVHSWPLPSCGTRSCWVFDCLSIVLRLNLELAVSGRYFNNCSDGVLSTVPISDSCVLWAGSLLDITLVMCTMTWTALTCVLLFVSEYTSIWLVRLKFTWIVLDGYPALSVQMSFDLWIKCTSMLHVATMQCWLIIAVDPSFFIFCINVFYFATNHKFAH